MQNLVANLYSEVYNGPPFFESWDWSSAYDELLTSASKKGFVGVFAISNSELVGFSWSYLLPNCEVDRIDFPKMQNALMEKSLDPSKAVYGAETGVKDLFRNRGIATAMLSERVSQYADCETVLFRTKNPQMVRLYENTIGPVLFSFPEESSYVGGRVYVFDLKSRK